MTKSTGKLSRVLGARLHPSDEHEAEALVVWDDLRNQNYTPRQIITHALLHASGHKPDMFRREGRIDSVIDALETRLDSLTPLADMNVKLDALAMRLDESLAEMLRAIRQADPDGLRAFADQREDVSADLDAEFLRNAQKAARKTFKQKGL